MPKNRWSSPFQNSKFGQSLSCLAYNIFCSRVYSNKPSFTKHLNGASGIFRINSRCTSAKLQITDEGISLENVTDFLYNGQRVFHLLGVGTSPSLLLSSLLKTLLSSTSSSPAGSNKIFNGRNHYTNPWK